MKRTQHLLLRKKEKEKQTNQKTTHKKLGIFSFEGLTRDFFVLQYWQCGTEKTRCELWWFPGKLNFPGEAFIHSRICRIAT